MVVNIKVLMALSLALSVSQFAHAAKLVSHCTMTDDTKTISGLNPEEKLPLASVSKIFTSLFSATSFNLDGKFNTQIYVTDVGRGQVDVHIQGSRDPYFNRFKMHMIISKLNEIRATNIRVLSFDENVKYLHDTDTSAGFRVGKTFIRPLILKQDLEFPFPDLVKAELMQFSNFSNSKNLLKDYGKSVQIAQANKLDLFKNPKLNISQVNFKSLVNFKVSPGSQKLPIASQDIKTILKSINWNSNNHAANQMFAAAGGIEKFNSLFYGKFGLSPDDVTFVNGSGQNHDLKNSGRLYNEATCSAVVRTVRMLKRTAESQGSKLQDVMSVVGVDIGSTVGGATYSSAATKNTVIAKTGTVGTNVTLAGVINSITEGSVYFMYNVSIKSFKSKRAQNAEEIRARRIISTELHKLVKEIGGAKSLNYASENPLHDTMENFDETVMNTVEAAKEPISESAAEMSTFDDPSENEPGAVVPEIFSN